MKKIKSISGIQGDHQRGGNDEIEGFDYSFNPKVSTALVLYKNNPMTYLESLVPNTPEAEISKEVINYINYKQVKKILKEGKYNFNDPKRINLPENYKAKSDINYSSTLSSLKGKNSPLNMTGPFKLGHNVENYLIYKNLKNKNNYSTQTLDPVHESKIFRFIL